MAAMQFTRDNPFQLMPDTPAKWNTAATMAGVQNVSIKSFDDHHSGSNITKRQVLTLRALSNWARSRPRHFNAARYGLAAAIQTARQRLAASADFAAYLGAIRTPGTNLTGYFLALHDQQQEVVRGVPRAVQARKYQRIDESPVNSYLVNLVTGILRAGQVTTRRSRHSKIQFVASYRVHNTTGRNGFKSVTDGQIQGATNPSQVIAVYECKRGLRTEMTPDVRNAVEMQEAGMLVALVKEHPGLQRQRVLISQDGTEIYVTFATYDDQWVRYVTHGQPKAGFLRLQRHGPYSILNADELSQAAEIILAICL